MNIVASGNWRLVVTTKSGSKYYFESRNGQITFHKGLVEGIVMKFLDGEVKIGERLRFLSCDYDLYSNLDPEPKYTATTTVVRVEFHSVEIPEVEVLG